MESPQFSGEPCRLLLSLPLQSTALCYGLGTERMDLKMDLFNVKPIKIYTRLAVYLRLTKHLLLHSLGTLNIFYGGSWS